MTIIIKANGEKEQFSEEKLLKSIQRAGVPKDVQQQALTHVTKNLRENIPTSEIYKHIIEFLDKSPLPFAKAKYSLKQSLMDLGPTGYPFEDYLSRLLTEQGFTTTVRNMITGKCVVHEIDIIAQKGKEKYMVEAKFHNSLGIKTDIHVALYTQARFEDVAEKEHFTKALLITNTKASSEVLVYSQCVGMDVISWDYPENTSLRSLVEKYAMYPITALTRLPHIFRQQLLEQGIVLCRDICKDESLITRLPLSDEEKKHILEEASFLCKTS